jgi:hypothetical protein
MPKTKSDMSAESDKKKHVITLDMKLGIIKLFDKGQSKTRINLVLGLSGSMV